MYLNTNSIPRKTRWQGRYFGTVERLDTALVRGWCVHSRKLGKPLRVKVYLCGVLIGVTRCDIPRPDLARIFGEHCVGGFHFRWKDARQIPLQKAMNRLRRMKQTTSASSVVRLRIKGSFFKVSTKHLGQFCAPIAIRDLEAALAWISDLPARAAPAPNGAPAANKPVLLVVHDALKFGAQLFLVRYAEWLSIHEPGLRLEFLISVQRNGTGAGGSEVGSIPARLRRIGPVFYLDESNCPENLEQIDDGHYQLIYLNSLASIFCLGRLPGGDTPLLIHAHELHWAARMFLTPAVRRHIAARRAHFVGCSQAVVDMLKTELAVPEERLNLVHSFVPDFRSAESQNAIDQPVDALRSPDGKVLIVGTVGWRKGGFLLGAIAGLLKRNHGLEPRFVWTGTVFDQNCASAMRFEFSQLGLGDRLELTGHQESVDTHYRDADLLLLPSVEDPFPLVMIEAGLHGLPIVAFDGSGGASEFVQPKNAGLIAPFLDLGALAEAIAKVLRDSDLRRSLGTNARATAKQYTDTVQGPKLLQTMKHAANSK